VRNLRAGWSNSIRSARNSVVRDIRDTREITTMPAMNANEITMPSGFSISFAASA
jgi:hypothetical protein